MKVKFFAQIREYTKAKEIDFEYCESLNILLLKLCARYGDRFKKKIFNGSDLSKEVIIMVNGRHIEHLQGINTILNIDDEISIFPVIAGG